MKIVIEMSKWYARGVVEVEEDDYGAKLLDDNGRMCCLGFCAKEHGAEYITGLDCPEDAVHQLPKSDWMLDESTSRNVMVDSELARLAIMINDGGAEFDTPGIDWWKEEPLEVRMGNLITIFAEGGDELEFAP